MGRGSRIKNNATGVATRSKVKGWESAAARISATPIGELPELKDFIELCDLDYAGITNTDPEITDLRIFGDPANRASVVGESAMEVKTELILKGEKVGESVIWYQQDGFENENRWVKLSYLDLNESARGRGYGRYRHQELSRRFQAAGIDQIKIWAQHRGSYMWASEGYMFDTTEDRPRPGYRYLDTDEEMLREIYARDCVDAAEACFRRRRNHLETLAETGVISRGLLESLEEDIKSGKLLTPKDLASYGQEKTWVVEGHTSWLGKELMIENDWFGVKPLNDKRFERVDSPSSK